MATPSIRRTRTQRIEEAEALAAKLKQEQAEADAKKNDAHYRSIDATGKALTRFRDSVKLAPEDRLVVDTVLEIIATTKASTLKARDKTAEMFPADAAK